MLTVIRLLFVGGMAYLTLKPPDTARTDHISQRKGQILISLYCGLKFIFPFNEMLIFNRG